VTELAALTSPQIGERAAAGALLVVPIGSTEQHGPHLPLGTDTDIALTLCRRLAERRDDVVIAPAIAYGSSGEHAGFAGTLSIGQQALTALLIELGRSATDTFHRLVFVSAHGGNAQPVSAAVATLRSESRSVLLWGPRWLGDAHAGRTETSLQLAIDPTRVDLTVAQPGNSKPLAELMPLLATGGVRAVSANGILGDPAGATAAEGRELLVTLTDDLERAVREFVS
jgi:mycofactocin system creatininase family protein